MRKKRSFARMTDEDLERLAEIAWMAFEEMCGRKPRRAAYRERLLAIALCQGAACHHLDRRTGIKDFDVWLFFAEIPGQPFPCRWHLRRDFGPSRFGWTPHFKGQGGAGGCVGAFAEGAPGCGSGGGASGVFGGGPDKIGAGTSEKGGCSPASPGAAREGCVARLLRLEGSAGVRTPGGSLHPALSWP